MRAGDFAGEARLSRQHRIFSRSPASGATSVRRWMNPQLPLSSTQHRSSRCGTIETTTEDTDHTEKDGIDSFVSFVPFVVLSRLFNRRAEKTGHAGSCSSRDPWHARRRTTEHTEGTEMNEPGLLLFSVCSVCSVVLRFDVKRGTTKSTNDTKRIGVQRRSLNRRRCASWRFTHRRTDVAPLACGLQLHSRYAPFYPWHPRDPRFDSLVSCNRCRAGCSFSSSRKFQT